jgi:hypothetical protein
MDGRKLVLLCYKDIKLDWLRLSINSPLREVGCLPLSPWPLDQVDWFLSSYVVSSGETRGTFTPNIEQRQAEHRVYMHGAKLNFRHYCSAAETWGASTKY